MEPTIAALPVPLPSTHSANKVDHPKTAYVKESAMTPRTRPMARHNCSIRRTSTHTVEQLLGASKSDGGEDANAEAARRKLADCDDRLKKYRAALDSGADPVNRGWLDV